MSEVQITHAELIEAFKIFDQDGTGSISRAELRFAMERLAGERLTEPELDDMMGEADRDGDGLINVVEFIRIMSK
ncbi:EF-hand [Pluteus cervinus]|uniref:EF-hand n=1 Tax=Pluteus cervinus TaxID=181527 RepID=A0ACD3A4Z2_9AGAR|nr:EF-hand [Pluteus cervinus]